MYKILEKRMLNDTVAQMKIDAPLVAQRALAGQFIVLRTDEKGERIPLTIAGYDRGKGEVDIIFQLVGQTTMQLGAMKEGEYISDFLGPLGKPSEILGEKNALVIGGGVGCAIAYPLSKALNESGCPADSILGFRSRDIVILEDEFRKESKNLYLMTDDGSYSEKGFVTDKLIELLDKGIKYDVVVAIGPVPMMKAVSDATRPYGVKTLASLNPIMIDGTGMCGCCRVTVADKQRFACVDGPEFDAHEVDFGSLSLRNGQYREYEREHMDKCRLIEAAYEK